MTRVEIAAQLLQIVITKKGLPYAEPQEQGYVDLAYRLADLLLAGPSKKEVTDDQLSFDFHSSEPKPEHTSRPIAEFVPGREPVEP